MSCENNELRRKAISWWNTFTFEEQFYKVIQWLSDQGKKTDERHPHYLTGREIEEIYTKYSDK